jgi:hypothetical protein
MACSRSDQTIDCEPKAWGKILRAVPDILKHFTARDIQPSLDQIYLKAADIDIGLNVDNRNLLRHALKCMGAEEGKSNALYQLRKLSHIGRHDWKGMLKRWPMWGEHRDHSQFRPGQFESNAKAFGEAMNWTYGRFKDIPDYDRLSHLLPHAVNTLISNRGGYGADRHVTWDELYKCVELHENDTDSFIKELKPELDKLRESYDEHMKSNRDSDATPAQWALVFSQYNNSIGGSEALKDTFKNNEEKVYETAAGRPQLPTPDFGDRHKRTRGNGDEEDSSSEDEKQPEKAKGPLTVTPFIFEKDQYPEIARERPNMENFSIPSFPSVFLVVGGVGSGKTSNMAFLLTSPNAYGGDLEHSNLHPFFKPDNIFLFGQSMDSDPTWVEVRKKLKIPDDNVYVEMTEDDLKGVLDKMEESAKKHKDKTNCPRHLLIYDDAIAATEFIMSDQVIRSAVRPRHLCMSLWFSTQSLTKAPRLLRMQAQAVCYWAGNATRQDQELLFEEWGSGGMSKKDWFRDIMPHFREKHTFLYVNRNLDPQDRYHINYDSIIRWTHVEDQRALKMVAKEQEDQEGEAVSREKEKQSKNKKQRVSLKP